MEKFKSSSAKIIFRMIKQGELNNVSVKSMDVVLKCLDQFVLYVFTFLEILLWIINVYLLLFLQLITYFTNCMVSFWPGPSKGYLIFVMMLIFPKNLGTQSVGHATTPNH